MFDPDKRFQVQHTDDATARVVSNHGYSADTIEEAKSKCDEVWTPTCRQEITDEQAGGGWVRASGAREWSRKL